MKASGVLFLLNLKSKYVHFILAQILNVWITLCVCSIILLLHIIINSTTMNRRPFIKLLGIHAISLPLLNHATSLFAAKPFEENWFNQLLNEGQIESKVLFSAQAQLPLPLAVQQGEFKSINQTLYYYQQRQFCFQVFEKRHPVLGQLDLMLPFWKRQADGTWKPIASLNAFDLKALAKAIENGYSASAFLPLAPHQASQSYACEAGLVHTATYIGMDNSARTQLKISPLSANGKPMEFTATVHRSA